MGRQKIEYEKKVEIVRNYLSGKIGREESIRCGYTEYTSDISIASSSYSGALELERPFMAEADGGLPTFFDVSPYSSTRLPDFANVTLKAATRTSVFYNDLQGDTQSAECVLISENTTKLLNNSWYALTDNITINNEIVAKGAVDLILADGCTLNVTNVKVAAGSSLTIWGQSGGSGHLVARSDNGAKAGIGGSNSDCGTITINGGTVTATGGSDGGAGIGGGAVDSNHSDCVNGGRVEIHGGTVTARGGLGAAGIGSGIKQTAGDNGTIQITGGTVTAYGNKVAASSYMYWYASKAGAAIGGGVGGNAGTIEISGGTVTADANSGIGIGAGSETDTISGSSIHISGGRVTAYGSEERGSAIGGGLWSGSVDIRIYGGVDRATGGIGQRDYRVCSPCPITLSWTDASKDSMSIMADDYRAKVEGDGPTLEKPFLDASSQKIFDPADSVSASDLKWKTLTPYSYEAKSVKVTVTSGPETGSASATPNPANDGDTVTVTPAPRGGYYTSSVTLIFNGQSTRIKMNEAGIYSFTMPRMAVEVQVELKPLESASSWAQLQNQINNATNEAVITLKYFQGDDVTAANSDFALQISTGKTITLDLAGKTLDRNADNDVDYDCVIKNYGTLTITDSVGGGKITGGWMNGDVGGGILNNGTLTINGGAITDNRATNVGGGILNNGTLTINGGAITGNRVNNDGGGIYNRPGATLTMSGGAISANVADVHGGVLNEGSMTMSGGTISENNAENRGGGIHNLRGGVLNLSGGTITGNKHEYYHSSSRAGGILQEGVINISGNPVVKGNQNIKGVTYEDNIYLAGGDHIINVIGELTEGAELGVCLISDNGIGAITSGFSANNPNLDPADVFTADREHSVQLGSGEAVLVPWVTVTFDSDGGSEVEAQLVGKGYPATEPGMPTKEGYILSAWKLDNQIFDFSTPVTGDITLKAQWSPVDFMLPASLAVIGNEAFSGISGKIIVVPSIQSSEASVSQVISANAFAGCRNLTVYIPEGWQIEARAFDGSEGIVLCGPAGGAANDYAETHPERCSFRPVG